MSSPQTPTHLLSATQAARLCGDVHTTTFLRWVKSGTAPAPGYTSRAGDLWDVSVIEAFAAERVKEAA